MGQQVKDFIKRHDPQAHGVTFAIHQSKSECVATFHKLRETEEVAFTGWNEDVKNRTSCHSEADLLEAYIYRTWNVSNDWFSIEILPF